jgi:glutamyl-tRNA synthetase
MLGWNDGTDKEIFSMEELIANFSLDRVHKAGAKFDYEKAKWFNAEWIKKTANEKLAELVKPYFDKAGIEVHDPAYLVKIIGLVKERCILLPDFITQSVFFFQAPATIDLASIQPKWDSKKQDFFVELVKIYTDKITQGFKTLPAETLESDFKELATTHGLKPGELMLPFRIMLVGGKFGPGVFEIVENIELQDALTRINHTLSQLSSN